MASLLAEIQCLPSPAGPDDDRYDYVEAAIVEIQRADVCHEVGALGTTVEGEPDVVWPLLRRVHDACLAAGADSAVTVIKVYGAADGRTPGIDDLTARFRDRQGPRADGDGDGPSGAPATGVAPGGAGRVAPGNDGRVVDPG